MYPRRTTESRTRWQHRLAVNHLSGLQRLQDTIDLRAGARTPEVGHVQTRTALLWRRYVDVKSGVSVRLAIYGRKVRTLVVRGRDAFIAALEEVGNFWKGLASMVR